MSQHNFLGRIESKRLEIEVLKFGLRISVSISLSETFLIER